LDDGRDILGLIIETAEDPLSKDSANARSVRGKSTQNVQPTLNPFGYRVPWWGRLSLFLSGNNHLSHSFRSWRSRWDSNHRRFPQRETLAAGTI
jgi:hypothetical protein